MRKSDKIKNLKQANLVAEQRYLLGKGIITETEFNATLLEDKKRYYYSDDPQDAPDYDDEEEEEDDDDNFREPEEGDPNDIGVKGRNLEFGGEDY
jgi:hypothetical protein